ncbi:hypothetical protein PAXRUDRAFT_19045 [Paxillus rubicundulus Ve08.2h10]|uniref:Uncharacterized protein n=1 Tax=Paxillus rubicundulus Ve08.2h10 TaxID=930991 RepID=A0A0D0CWD7_9AGAM|nr:hypothetical protein PAXRUDRAFT_19045 [Paxillus rubicundulus Ve08.2h10]
MFCLSHSESRNSLWAAQPGLEGLELEQSDFQLCTSRLQCSAQLSGAPGWIQELASVRALADSRS